MATATKTRKPAEKSERADARDSIIDSLIESMADNNAPWQKDWTAEGMATLLPHNLKTGAAYTGTNALWLALLAQARGYESNGWATFNQMKDFGGNVTGQRGTSLLLWKPFQPKDKDTGKPAVDDKGNPRMAGMFKTFTVFHESQITGATFPERATREPVASPEAVDRLVAGSGAIVEHRGAQSPAYYPTLDKIVMSLKEAYTSPEGYAADLLHEMGHWTGHESRLKRDSAAHSIDPAKYAAEELVAEMTAFLTCLALGIEYQRSNHESYLKHWSRGDLALVKGAASAAKRASDLLLSYA
jgi:antirestriction protein ArdC